MAWQLSFSKQSVSDMEEVLEWTCHEFGEQQYEHYRGYIKDALAELIKDPHHAMVKKRDEIHPDAYTSHISRIGKKARHFFLFRLDEDARIIEIGRFLHDCMELTNHLPQEYE